MLILDSKFFKWTLFILLSILPFTSLVSNFLQLELMWVFDTPHLSLLPILRFFLSCYHLSSFFKTVFLSKLLSSVSLCNSWPCRFSSLSGHLGNNLYYSKIMSPIFSDNCIILSSRIASSLSGSVVILWSRLIFFKHHCLKVFFLNSDQLFLLFSVYLNLFWQKINKTFISPSS